MRPTLWLQCETDLGDAWGGNSVNCTPYRVAPMITTDQHRLISFFDSGGNVRISRKALDEVKLEHFGIENLRKPFDAHQAISMGQDSRGRLHLAFGAHVQPLRLICSKTAVLEDGFVGPVETFSQATYPMY